MKDDLSAEDGTKRDVIDDVSSSGKAASSDAARSDDDFDEDDYLDDEDYEKDLYPIQKFKFKS